MATMRLALWLKIGWTLDPGTIDALALSHGHWDHWGGLAGLLRTYRRAMKKRLTLPIQTSHLPSM